MTIEIIPTHKVSLYGVRCYFNEDTAEICGTNWFFNLLIVPVCTLHNVIITINSYVIPGYEYEGGFPLVYLEEYDAEESLK